MIIRTWSVTDINILSPKWMQWTIKYCLGPKMVIIHTLSSFVKASGSLDFDISLLYLNKLTCKEQCSQYWVCAWNPWSFFFSFGKWYLEQWCLVWTVTPTWFSAQANLGQQITTVSSFLHIWVPIKTCLLEVKLSTLPSSKTDA